MTEDGLVLPTFLCVGAEKAGTSPLFFLLRQHPDIFVPRQKELHFFSRSSLPADVAHYETVLSIEYNGQRAIGEFTPDYMRVPENAHRLRQLLGPLKIIFCLREPLRRAFSHYHQCLRILEDNRSFFTACEADAYCRGESIDHTGTRRAYVRGSIYPSQIEAFLSEFGRENLFFMILERDLATPDAKFRLLQRLFRFLDVRLYPGVAINLNVPNTSLPCPSIEFIRSDSTNAIEGTRAPPVTTAKGDIVLITGNRNLDRLIKHPSEHAQQFFLKMARDMTRRLQPEDVKRLRARYFAGVVERTSEITECDLTAFWSEDGDLKTALETTLSPGRIEVSHRRVR